MISLSDGCDRLVDGVSRSGGLKLSEHAAQKRLKTAFLGTNELLGDSEAAEADESLIDLLEALFQHCGSRGS